MTNIQKDLEEVTANGLAVLQEMGYKIVPNIHSDCENYSESKDMCLKYFKTNISELKECQEKTTFSDKELSRKWSN